jgi:antirestriction protein ArdC
VAPALERREHGRKRFGDEGYAREELVAELGSAFLSADLGITPDVRDDHASYIASWLEVLKNETRFIVTAATRSARPIICTACRAHLQIRRSSPRRPFRPPFLRRVRPR